MSELLRRMLLATEAIVISFPLTAFFVTDKGPALLHRVAASPRPEASLAFTACVALLVYAGCQWRLIVAFSVDGSAALQRLFLPYWYVPHVALAVAAGALAIASAAFTVDTTSLRQLAWALPMAIPSVHLAIECLLRRGASAGTAAAVTASVRSRASTTLTLVR